MSRVSLDARGLLCPMPVIRVQNRVAELEAGTIIRVVGTDPGILNDVPAWCKINGHQLLEVTREGDDYVVVLKVGAYDER